MAHDTRFHARLFALITLVLPATVAAAGGHVSLPFIRKGKGPGPGMSKRDVSTISTTDNKSPYAFVAEVTVGTPPQKMELVITTSTGQSWVQDGQSSYCLSSTDYEYPLAEDGFYDFTKDPKKIVIPGYCLLGSFNESSSSSYERANQEYRTFSVDLGGRRVSGQNFTDNLVVGNMELPDMPMGLVSSSSGSSFVGVLGLGYNSTTSSPYEYSYSYDYHPSFMDRMVQGNHIVTRAFSMWLDDAEGKSGGLLLGAVDQSRYEGELKRIKAVNKYAYPGSFGVTVDGLTFSNDTGSEMQSLTTNEFPLGVTFGPGEVISYLPTRIYDKIAELTGATFNSTLGVSTIPCDAAKTRNAKFSFRLSGPDGPVVNLETADLVVSQNMLVGSRSPYSTPRDENLCVFGVQEAVTSSSSSSSYSSDEYYIFGSTLLRRTFLAFDLENREVAVAPVRFSSGLDGASPTIVAFESSGAPVPSATLYCGDSACIEYCRYRNCDSTSTSGPGSPGGNGYGSRPYGRPASYEGPHYWRDVAIGVGVTFGVLALIGGIAIAILVVRIIRGKPVKGKDVEEDGSEDETPGPGQEMSGAGSTGMRTALPVIREGQEDADSAAPQLPVLSKGLGDPMTTPKRPLTPSNGDSVAVSAVSASDVPVSQPTQTAAPGVEGNSAAVSADNLPAPQPTQTAVPAVEGNPTSLSKGKGVEAVENRQI